MNRHHKPVAGNWYNHLGKGQLFRVIDVDEDEDLVEIQYFDGDIEEIEAAEWYGLHIEPAAAPEDWTGPLDDVETDDLGLSETAMKDRDWQESLETSRPPEESWQDETEAEERDDWGEGPPAEELYGTEPPRTIRATPRRSH